ncbi:MAG: hypothetical protein K0R14_2169 [Burkholderiales bacterium]|jgi:hypothetical protein|nr:hypothetical protein [Burkholderiales bacterium]
MLTDTTLCKNNSLSTINIAVSPEETSAINSIIDIFMSKKGGLEKLLPVMADTYPKNPDIQILAAIMYFFSVSTQTIQSNFPKYLSRIKFEDLDLARQMHYKALLLLQNNDLEAAFFLYCDLVYLNPQDKLAISMLEPVGFVAGKINELLKPYEFLSKYHKNDLDFLAMLAFLYAHINREDQGLSLIKGALEKDPQNARLQHVYAHLIMPDKVKEGICQLEEYSICWPLYNRFFEVHNWMHLCSLYLQQPSCDINLILHNYHKYIWGGSKNSCSEQNNAFLTLWNIELAIKERRVDCASNIDELWQDLANHAEPFTRDYFTPYLTVTAILTLARVNPYKANLALVDFELFSNGFDKSSSKYYAWNTIALQILKGCLAYLNKDYELAVRLLAPVHDMTMPMGHSEEQRSIFSATFFLSQNLLNRYIYKPGR